MKLFNTNIYVFIVILIITIIITILYVVFQVDRPTDLQYFNKIDPFPTIEIKNLPNPIDTENVKDCNTKLVSCNNENDCSNQCGSDYECSIIEKDDNIVYNNIKVGEGKWCLPKNRLKGCGKYTGRTVWSADEQGQKWKCECLYPSLFTGKYCTDNIACKDTSNNALNINQSNNVLVNKDGEIYDPNLPNFTPPNGVSNPYSVDKDGNPIYSCSCGRGSNNKRFVKYNNDPYKCHLDPCTIDHSSNFWDSANQTCICDEGSVKDENGKCVTAGCSYGVYNSKTQRCECAGRMARMLCNSKNVPRPGYPNCDDPENLLGQQCIDRCMYKYCQNTDYSKCGIDWKTGENRGYRPEFCEDKSCVVCGAGNCIINDKDDISCVCGVGTSYSPVTDNPNDKTPGICTQIGNKAGEGCYHFSQKNSSDINPLKYRLFWVYEDSDAKNKNSKNTYQAWNINYKKDTENGSFASNKKGDAISKCNTRCATKQVASTPKELQDLLNKMTSCEGVDSKKCKELRKRRDKFLDDYCDSDLYGAGNYVRRMVDSNAYTFQDQDPDAKSRLNKGIEAQASIFKSSKGEMTYACGMMCDGDL